MYECILKKGVIFMSEKYWSSWTKAAVIRAVKTMAQTAISILTVNAAGLLDVDWVAVGSAAVLAAIVSMLTSLAGLPEVDESEKE